MKASYFCDIPEGKCMLAVKQEHTFFPCMQCLKKKNEIPSLHMTNNGTGQVRKVFTTALNNFKHIAKFFERKKQNWTSKRGMPTAFFKLLLVKQTKRFVVKSFFMAKSRANWPIYYLHGEAGASSTSWNIQKLEGISDVLAFLIWSKDEIDGLEKENL